MKRGLIADSWGEFGVKEERFHPTLHMYETMGKDLYSYLSGYQVSRRVINLGIRLVKHNLPVPKILGPYVGLLSEMVEEADYPTEMYHGPWIQTDGTYAIRSLHSLRVYSRDSSNNLPSVGNFFVTRCVGTALSWSVYMCKRMVCVMPHLVMVGDLTEDTVFRAKGVDYFVGGSSVSNEIHTPTFDPMLSTTLWLTGIDLSRLVQRPDAGWHMLLYADPMLGSTDRQLAEAALVQSLSKVPGMPCTLEQINFNARVFISSLEVQACGDRHRFETLLSEKLASIHTTRLFQQAVMNPRPVVPDVIEVPFDDPPLRLPLTTSGMESAIAINVPGPVRAPITAREDFQFEGDIPQDRVISASGLLLTTKKVAPVKRKKKKDVFSDIAVPFSSLGVRDRKLIANGLETLCYLPSPNVLLPGVLVSALLVTNPGGGDIGEKRGRAELARIENALYAYYMDHRTTYSELYYCAVVLPTEVIEKLVFHLLRIFHSVVNPVWDNDTHPPNRNIKDTETARAAHASALDLIKSPELTAAAIAATFAYDPTCIIRFLYFGKSLFFEYGGEAIDPYVSFYIVVQANVKNINIRITRFRPYAYLSGATLCETVPLSRLSGPHARLIRGVHNPALGLIDMGCHVYRVECSCQHSWSAHLTHRILPGPYWVTVFSDGGLYASRPFFAATNRKHKCDVGLPCSAPGLPSDVCDVPGFPSFSVCGKRVFENACGEYVRD